MALGPRCRINGGAAERVPGIVNVTLAGVDAEALVVQLDQAGVACSTGSACASGAAQPSHVLLAMGRDEVEARSSLRLSLGPTLSEADLDEALRRMAEALRAQAREGVGPGQAS
jgi:cysteine desulfurase